MSMVYSVDNSMLGLLPVLLSGIPSGAFQVVMYVFSSLAFYTIASRRGLKKPWLAWIPVVNVWILGSLSDQYRYVVKGQYKSKRKSLLVLNILSTVLTLTLLVMALVWVGGAFAAGPHGMVAGDGADMIAAALSVLGLSLPLVGVVIAICILRYMALYDVFRSLDPDNAILFLVLSILFRVTEPFFLFFSREKDLGMPPRRQPQPEAWTQESYDL